MQNLSHCLGVWAALKRKRLALHDASFNGMDDCTNLVARGFVQARLVVHCELRDGHAAARCGNFMLGSFGLIAMLEQHAVHLPHYVRFCLVGQERFRRHGDVIDIARVDKTLGCELAEQLGLIPPEHEIGKE